MAKLYFRFGAMGCSKSAQALITKFNYEERNMKVMFIKPAIDTRDGVDIVRSRIGLSAKAIAVPSDMDLYELYKNNHADCQVVICDECQFLTEKQVEPSSLTFFNGQPVISIISFSKFNRFSSNFLYSPENKTCFNLSFLTNSSNLL